MSNPSVQLAATEALRGLVSEIRMIPEAEAPGGHRMEPIGESAVILAIADGRQGPDMPKPPRLARAGSETMVAGTGFANCFAISNAIIPPFPAKAA